MYCVRGLESYSPNYIDTRTTFVRDIIFEQNKYRALDLNYTVRLSALSLFRSAKDVQIAVKNAKQDEVDAKQIYYHDNSRNTVTTTTSTTGIMKNENSTANNHHSGSNNNGGIYKGKSTIKNEGSNQQRNNTIKNSQKHFTSNNNHPATTKPATALSKMALEMNSNPSFNSRRKRTSGVIPKSQ